MARDSSAEAWAAAERLLEGLDRHHIDRVQNILAASESTSQARMSALHERFRADWKTSDLEVYPNVWAGVGLVRGGAGTALVGSHAEVADAPTYEISARIADWQAGVTELDGRGAWRLRVITAPLTVLAAVHLVHIGVPMTGAACHCLGRLAGPDVIQVINIFARISLHQITPMLGPTHAAVGSHEFFRPVMQPASPHKLLPEAPAGRKTTRKVST